MKTLCMLTVLSMVLGAAMTTPADEPGGVLAPAGDLVADAAGAPPAEKPGAAHVPEVAAAPAKDWTVTVGGDWYNEYIFRGVDLTGNNPIYVPYLIGTFKGFSAYYYGYYGHIDAPKNNWYEEADFGIDYTLPLFDGKLAITAGGLGYVYFDGHSGTDTFEVYGKVVWVNWFNPTLTLNWDVHAFHTGYGTVSINHAFDLSKLINLKEPMTLSIVPSASLGIDFGYNSRETQSNVNWNDVLLGVNVPFQITPNFCVHAQVQWSIALNSLNDIGQGNEVIGSFGASLKF